jgi:hypothetical protein
MNQTANIRLVVEEAVQRFGIGAYAYLYERAEIKNLMGDMESATSWWDIALASIDIWNERDLRLVRVALM